MTVGTIFVARSPNLSEWGYDVGLSKNLYRVGYTEGSAKDEIAQDWAGEGDWVLVKKQDGVEGLTKDAIIERLALKEKMIDPALYPRIKGERGIFKVPPSRVENHILVARAMAGETELKTAKVKHPDFAAYLIANAIS